MNKATRITVSTIGVISGLYGIEHGIGELLQGNVAPAGIMIQAWPNAALFDIIGGEPAMTIIPNMILTGIAAVVVSTIVAIWSLAGVSKRFGGPILIFLSILQLLAGGGIAPIVQLIVVGLAAITIGTSHSFLRKHFSRKTLTVLEQSWVWLFVLTVILCLLLFPGSIMLGQLFPNIDPGVFVSISNLYLICLLITVVTSFFHDASILERRETV